MGRAFNLFTAVRLRFLQDFNDLLDQNVFDLDSDHCQEYLLDALKIAYIYSDVLKEVAKLHGIEVAGIYKNPMEGLIDFHAV